MPLRHLRRGLDCVFGSTTHDSINTDSVDATAAGAGSVTTDSVNTTALTFETFPRAALITANTTVSDAGWIYPVDTGGAAVSVTLASAMVAEGAHVTVNDEGGNAALNAITIATEGAETIDGATSQSIASNYGTLSLYSDGTNWFTK